MKSSFATTMGKTAIAVAALLFAPPVAAQAGKPFDIVFVNETTAAVRIVITAPEREDLGDLQVNEALEVDFNAGEVVEITQGGKLLKRLVVSQSRTERIRAGGQAAADQPKNQPKDQPSRRPVIAEVIFVNRTPGVVSVYWVDPTQGEQFYFQLQAGKAVQGGSYVGHTWVVRDEAKKKVAEFTITQAKQTIDIGKTPSPRISVPYLLGLTSEQAEAALTSVGLAPVKTFDVNTPAGDRNEAVVVKQAPLADVEAAPGSQVTYTLGKATMVTVPTLVGLSDQQAEATLKQLGLVLRNDSGLSGSDDGAVAGQLPQAGARVAQGSQVTYSPADSNDAKPLTPAALIGQYQHLPVEAPWHEGAITFDGGELLRWTNKVGEGHWGLMPDFSRRILLTDSDNPFHLKAGLRPAFEIKSTNGEVTGFVFNGVAYVRKHDARNVGGVWEVRIPGADASPEYRAVRKTGQGLQLVNPTEIRLAGAPRMFNELSVADFTRSPGNPDLYEYRNGDELITLEFSSEDSATLTHRTGPPNVVARFARVKEEAEFTFVNKWDTSLEVIRMDTNASISFAGGVPVLLPNATLKATLPVGTLLAAKQVSEGQFVGFHMATDASHPVVIDGVSLSVTNRGAAVETLQFEMATAKPAEGDNQATARYQLKPQETRRFVFAKGTELYVGAGGLTHFEGPLLADTELNLAERPYRVVFETGHEPGAGTDANIFIKLSGSKGTSEEVQAKLAGRNLFERGTQDITFVSLTKDIGALTELTVRSDMRNAAPEWYLYGVAVEGPVNGNYFDYDQWISDTSPHVRQADQSLANFSAFPREGVAPLIVNYWNRSRYQPFRSMWAAGDGNVRLGFNSTHQYLQPGTYDVTLQTIGDQWSDTRTKDAYIQVYERVRLEKLVGGDHAWGFAQNVPADIQLTANGVGGDVKQIVWNISNAAPREFSVAQLPADGKLHYAPRIENPGTYTISATLVGRGPGNVVTRMKTVTFGPNVNGKSYAEAERIMNATGYPIRRVGCEPLTTTLAAMKAFIINPTFQMAPWLTPAEQQEWEKARKSTNLGRSAAQRKIVDSTVAKVKQKLAQLAPREREFASKNYGAWPVTSTLLVLFEPRGLTIPGLTPAMPPYYRVELAIPK